jgi:hypothetical protein
MQTATEEATESEIMAVDSAASREDVIPFKPFPWPPPRATAFQTIDNNYFGSAKVLGDVESKIISALDKFGYTDRSYYSVPNGFAIATKLESINQDGSSKPTPERWEVKESEVNFFSSEYIKSIFISKKGFFRVIVILITDELLYQAKNSPSKAAALKMVIDGATRPPTSVRLIPFSKDHSVTALIYEYRTNNNATGSANIVPSDKSISGMDHLKKAKIWNEITRN